MEQGKQSAMDACAEQRKSSIFDFLPNAEFGLVQCPDVDTTSFDKLDGFLQFVFIAVGATAQVCQVVYAA